MNDILACNSVILTNVDELYYTLQLFKEIRKFDVIYISVNKNTKHVLTNENLIMLKRLCTDLDWTILIYFDGVVDAHIKKNIDIIFGDVYLNRICPLKHGFIAVYSRKLSNKDTIFAKVQNVYQIDDIVSSIYDIFIDMLVIDFNNGIDFDKINFLQKKLVYITKDFDVFSLNFRYKNIKKLSTKGDIE